LSSRASIVCTSIVVVAIDGLVLANAITNIGGARVIVITVAINRALWNSSPIPCNGSLDRIDLISIVVQWTAYGLVIVLDGGVRKHLDTITSTALIVITLAWYTGVGHDGTKFSIRVAKSILEVGTTAGTRGALVLVAALSIIKSV